MKPARTLSDFYLTRKGFCAPSGQRARVKALVEAQTVSLELPPHNWGSTEIYNRTTRAIQADQLEVK